MAAICAVMLPTVAHTRHSSKNKKSCAVNLWQVGLATGLYMEDADETFPNAVTLADRKHVPPSREVSLITKALERYASGPQIWRCPSDKELTRSDTSYDFSMLLGGVRSASIPAPVQMAYARDGSGLWHPHDRKPSDPPLFIAVYMDGHVSFGSDKETALTLWP